MSSPVESNIITHSISHLLHFSLVVISLSKPIYKYIACVFQDGLKIMKDICC